MKRIVGTITMLLWIGAVFAQTLPQGMGIQIGFAEPILRLNSPSQSMSKDSLANTTIMNGLKVGLVYDATFVKGFGSSIGINYTFAMGQTNWTRQSAISEYPQWRSRSTYHQIEVFVDWQYKFEIAKETYIILYSGPTIQCALSMNERTYVKDQFGKEENKSSISLFDYDDAELSKDFNRLNVTWGVGVGFQYQRYFLRGGYDFGLINPYKKANFNEMGIDIDRRTRGRLDQWNIRLGIYLWEH